MPTRTLRIGSLRLAARAAAMSALLVAGCKAPKSTPLEGPAIEQIQQGLTKGAATFSHEEFDALLKKHVDPNTDRVDYAGLQKDAAILDAYLARLASAKLNELGADEQLALLINAYNGYTLRLILDHYPIDSIKSIDDPWGSVRYVVGGNKVSLDNIEHNLIRPVYKDPRIHFAVNCAAIGCPPLRPFAFTGAQVDDQLEEVTRATLISDRYVRLRGNELAVSKIFDWYGSDFVTEGWKGAARDIPGYVGRYATPEVSARIKAGGISLGFLDYDWSLNDASAK